MGKPKTLSKKAKKLAKKKGLQISGSSVTEDADSHDMVQSKYSIDQILDKAAEFMDMYNYEMAQKFCQRALEIDNDNVRALEATATLLLEAGDAENARHCLGRAITVAPSTGHTKYLSLAQLMQGRESLELYKSALEIMNKLIEETESNMDKKTADQEEKLVNSISPQTLKQELSNTYCAIAELYMTDLCDENEAEQECESNIKKSIEVNESNPEAWQTKARFHLIKSEFEDAKSIMNVSLSKWLPLYTEALQSRPSSSGQKFDPVEVCPLLYTTRIQTAKILIELEDWDNATKVLDGLIEEDEDVVDTWYLLGWLNKLRADFERSKVTESKDEDISEGYLGNARYYLNKSMKVQHKTPTDDKELISHIEEILKEIGNDVEENNDKENEGEENWEDYETDSEDDINEMDQG